MSKLRILLADDHEVVRRGLKSLLETKPSWSVCGEAVNGCEAVEMTLELKPDVVILDITMPKLGGLEAAKKISKAVPKTELLVLTMHEPGPLVRPLLDAGVHAYVLKSDVGFDLLRAVELVAQHKTYLTPNVSTMLVEGFLKSSTRGSQTEPSCGNMTRRQREIVQLLGGGKSNKEVAATLNISVKTVEAHRATIMHKLNLRSFPALLRYAYHNKIIQI